MEEGIDEQSSLNEDVKYLDNPDDNADDDRSVSKKQSIDRDEEEEEEKEEAQWQCIPQHVVLHILSYIEKILDWHHTLRLVGKFRNDPTRNPVLLYRSLSADYGLPSRNTFLEAVRRNPLFRFILSQVERFSVPMHADYVDVEALPVMINRAMMPRLKELHGRGCDWEALSPLLEQDEGFLMSRIKTMQFCAVFNPDDCESFVRCMQSGQVQLNELSFALEYDQSLSDIIEIDPEAVLRNQQVLEIMPTHQRLSINGIMGPALMSNESALLHIQSLMITNSVTSRLSLAGLDRLSNLKTLTLFLGSIDDTNVLTSLVQKGRLQELNFDGNIEVSMDDIFHWFYRSTGSRLRLLTWKRMKYMFVNGQVDVYAL